MSFTVENLASDFNRLNFTTPHQSWLAGNQRTSNRNLQCLSSDDEEEEEEEEEDDDSDDEIDSSKIKTLLKKKPNVPLPSDEEGKKKKGIVFSSFVGVITYLFILNKCNR